ncbi:hypothetical protein F5Y08DRAFT_336306 [Xylaria arbuscula]|uniref:Uncharacterized protein n=1 Tax=Xylaria arbuscula TaxID=114810 RepID=A0A9W8N9I7_9PEZI|nr:hypothetical protein F5Y08DRAFT_336306 [Xylaria arbuscula]KAJ3563858.1 hypothetical protein NPX13_g8052 [Xylaria arbuscula]
MKTVIVTLAAILAATTIAVPVTQIAPRQVDPVGMVFSKVGSHLAPKPPAAKTNATTSAKPNTNKSTGPLDGLTKGLGLK